MSAHTSGPWSMGEGGHGIWADVKGVERRIVSVSLSALVGDVSAEAAEATKAERLANAALVAAAPDLLAAGRNAVEWCCGLKGERNLTLHHCEACAPMVAAIAKAEGKS